MALWDFVFGVSTSLQLLKKDICRKKAGFGQRIGKYKWGRGTGFPYSSHKVTGEDTAESSRAPWLDLLNIHNALARPDCRRQRAPQLGIPGHD